VWSVCDAVVVGPTTDSNGVETAVPEELIAMEKDLLTTESSQQFSDDIAPVCPKENKVVLPQPTEVQLQEKRKFSKSPKPVFANEAEKLMGNVVLIKEYLANQSWDLIALLTEEWTQEFKSAVWKQLTVEERKAVRESKSQFNT
jgi:putative DNA primase/helicase